MTCYDTNGTPITIGCIIEHTGHGERYRVCESGTDGYLESHDGPILVPEAANLAAEADELTETMADELGYYADNPESKLVLDLYHQYKECTK